MPNLLKTIISSILLGSIVIFLIYKGDVYFNSLLLICFLCGSYEIIKLKRLFLKISLIKLFADAKSEASFADNKSSKWYDLIYNICSRLLLIEHFAISIFWCSAITYILQPNCQHNNIPDIFNHYYCK